jgi:hypothetical protein
MVLMKKIKILYSLILTVLLAISCSIPDGIDSDTSFVNSIKDPSAVSALALITQDNSGKVTLIPRGEGVTSFEIEYGDGTTTVAKVAAGGSVTHIYREGAYKVKITGISLSGKKVVAEQNITVSFRSPENLVVTIENDRAVSKKVNVRATADFALFYDVYFGDVLNEVPVQVNNGESISHTYASAGTYTIKIVSKSGAIRTTNYQENFVVTAILAPTTSAPAPPSRQVVDVVSIFSDSYTNIGVSEWNPGWGQSTILTNPTIGSNAMLKYSLLNYTGIVTDYGNATNLSSMQYVHFDYWTPNATSLGFKIVNTSISSGPTKESQVDLSTITLNNWVSVDIPLSDFTTNRSAITQMLFASSGGTVFIDNLYFYKNPTPASGIEGTWKIAPEAGALGVGPAPGDKSWWAIDAAGVTARACYFDDTFVFGSNGSFSNVLGNSTWLEGWQGTSDACGTPVAPHNGSASATYVYNSTAHTITINGAGAYLGLPKATNAGELPNVSVPNSRVYSVTLSNGNNTMELIIEAGSGVFWQFKLVRV